MPTRLESLVIDSADPAALARFWATALGWEITFEEPDEVAVEPPGPEGLGIPLVFVPVPEGKCDEPRTDAMVAGGGWPAVGRVTF